jgi:hypothetical protein
MKDMNAGRIFAWLTARAALVFFISVAPSLMAADAALQNPDDGVAPMVMFAIAVVFTCVALALVGIGIVLAATAALALAAMTMLGIISTSVLAGIFKRRFSSGIRAFHYQLCAALGMPAGIGVLWFGVKLFHLQMRNRDALWIGAIAGVCSGLLLAFILVQAVRIAGRRILAAANRSTSEKDTPLPQKS